MGRGILEESKMHDEHGEGRESPTVCRGRGWREQWQTRLDIIMELKYLDSILRTLGSHWKVFNRAGVSDSSARKISVAVAPSRLNGNNGGREVPEKGVSGESEGMSNSAPTQF